MEFRGRSPARPLPDGRDSAGVQTNPTHGGPPRGNLPLRPGVVPTSRAKQLAAQLKMPEAVTIAMDDLAGLGRTLRRTLRSTNPRIGWRER